MLLAQSREGSNGCSSRKAEIEPNAIARAARSQFLLHGLLFAATCAALASGARAAETEPIRIQYGAGAGCPAAREFVAQVFARTAGARAAGESEPARAFIVEIRREGRRFAGSLVIEEKDGATIARKVTGAECSDVATVLALATALAIDPRAELAPLETLEKPLKPEPPPSPSPATPQPSASPATPQPSALLAGTAEVAGWRLSAAGRAAFGVAPKPALGASALFAFRRYPATFIGEVGLEFAYLRAGSESILNARAAFDFFLVRPVLCHAGVEIGARLRAAPCVATETGIVRGVGSAIPIASQETRFWVAAELLFRSELAFAGNAFVNLEGGLALPFSRYRFVFENPNTSIHQVPVVTGNAALRLGMHL